MRLAQLLNPWLIPLLALLTGPVAGSSSASISQEPETPGVLTAEQFLAEHDKRLSTHYYFSKVVLVREQVVGPIALYLQKPQVEAPDWRAKFTASHFPWLVKLEAAFRQKFADPLRLARRGEVPLNSYCVLQTHGDYVNYANAVKATGNVGPAGYFERRSRITVTFQEGGERSLVVRREEILIEFVRALLDAHYAGGVGEIRQAWLPFAMASYLTSGVGSTPETLDAIAPEKADFATLARFAGDAKLRDVYLVPIAELAESADWRHTWSRVAKRAEALRIEPRFEEFARAWNSECALWMHYLLDAGGPARRQSLLTHLSHAMQGRAVNEAFAKAFEGVDLRELDREFYRWVLAQHQKLEPAARVDMSVVERLFRPAATSAETAPGLAAAPAAENAASAPTPAEAFEIASLAPGADDYVVAHGALLQRIRRGELGPALAQLTELAARTKGTPIERRVQRDLERLKALVELRDAYFAQAIASGAKKSFVVDGKKVLARVRKLENDTLALEENRAGVASLPVAALPLAELVRDLPKELAAGPSGWARHFVAALENDERALAKLGRDDPRLVDLRDDFDTWYPGVLRAGAAAESLHRLVEAGAPVDIANAETCLASIRSLLAEYGALEFVDQRRSKLAQLASLAADSTFSLARAMDALPGQVVRASEDRLSWTLDFSDPKHLELFEFLPDFMADYRSALGELATPPSARLENGKIVFVGSGVWRLPIGLRPPLAMRADLTVQEVEGEGTAMLLMLAGVADDLTFVGMTHTGNLLVYQRSSQSYEMDWKETPYFLGVKYALELQVDAETARGAVNKSPRTQLATRGVGAGEIGVLLHSYLPCHLDNLVIEGQIDEASARTFWTRAQLRAAGL
jgi:hypothetical protein